MEGDILRLSLNYFTGSPGGLKTFLRELIRESVDCRENNYAFYGILFLFSILEAKPQ